MKKFNNNLLFYFLTGAGILFLCFAFVSPVLATTIVNSDITSDTTWISEGGPYVIEDSIDIVSGATLTINPGVIVKFNPLNNASINVFGRLVSAGEENNKIYFTSYYDDTVGGDTNDDFTCYEDFDENGNFLGEICYSILEPSRHDWGGINFIDSHNNYLKYAIFKYASNVGYLDHAYVNLKNIEILDSGEGFFANTSDIDADNTNCINLDNSCFYIVASSHVTWADSFVENILTDSIYVFDSSTLNLSNFSIKHISNSVPIYVFRDSFLNGDNLRLEDITGENNYGISLFNNSHLVLDHSSFSDCPGGACIIFFDLDEYTNTPSSLEIKNSVFDGGAGSGIFSFGESNISTDIKHSAIKNFTDFGIENYGTFTIQAKNNWWGNNTGPFHPDKNPSGTAGTVWNNVDFVPWCTNETCQTHDPVILIPGIMGTKIFKNYDDNSEIWPNLSALVLSITDNFLNDLSLNPDGTEDSTRPMQVGDIIRKIASTNIFDGLITELTTNGYIEDVDLFVFPYDWRKSNTENAEKLKNKIEQILAQTGGQKVDLIAHSMGGLVAKKYIADNTQEKVDQLIFVGTPQLGAPKAFKAIMYGDDMGIKIGPLSLLSPSRVKFISQNMPGVFELLPSKKYVDGQDDYLGEKYITDLITQNDSSSDQDLNFSQTKQFLLDQGKNDLLIPLADDFHQSIDNLDLTNSHVTNFIGCGDTKTVGRIIAKKKKSWTSLGKKVVDDFKINYTNGDGTVPLQSSLGTQGDKYYVKGSSHAELPSAEGLKDSILSILKGEMPESFSNVSKSIDDCYVSGTVVSVHSPVSLHIYDSFGNHTGPKPNGDIEFGIPGVQYDEIEGNKFAYLPDRGNYQIVNQAEDIGGYDFYIEKINEADESIGTTYWNDVSIDTLQANFRINISPTEIPMIKADEDGDGVFEKEFIPSSVLNGNQSKDQIPPTTVYSVDSGVISLSALDDDSGVLKTEYSLDGENWQIYESQINASEKTVWYFSTDKIGNVEQIKSINVPLVKGISSGGRPVVPISIPSILSKTQNTETIENENQKTVDRNEITKNYKMSLGFLSSRSVDTGSLKKEFGQGQTASLIQAGIGFKLKYLLYILCGFALFFIARVFIKR